MDTGVASPTSASSNRAVGSVWCPTRPFTRCATTTNVPQPNVDRDDVTDSAALLGARRISGRQVSNSTPAKTGQAFIRDACPAMKLHMRTGRLALAARRPEAEPLSERVSEAIGRVSDSSERWVSGGAAWSVVASERCR